MPANELKRIYRGLASAVDDLAFGPPVTHVYNPLVYAREPSERYLERIGDATGRILLLGMNPGPWGMAQTGVPFGAVSLVRGWMGIQGRVDRPASEHPKRPVRGFGIDREEISGQRFWGWARDRFGSPERFFQRFAVANYCPLVFMEDSGRNRTPDRLPVAEKVELFRHCDLALGRVVERLQPRWVIGIGRFATERARLSLAGVELPVGQLLHPSPASPLANRGWAAQAERQFRELGISLD
jgi:single-strand selective monofunctional uracil DNA glycosylase